MFFGGGVARMMARAPLALRAGFLWKVEFASSPTLNLPHPHQSLRPFPRYQILASSHRTLHQCVEPVSDEWGVKQGSDTNAKLDVVDVTRIYRTTFDCNEKLPCLRPWQNKNFLWSAFIVVGTSPNSGSVEAMPK